MTITKHDDQCEAVHHDFCHCEKRALAAELATSDENHGVTSALLGDAIRENDSLRAELAATKARLAEAERLLRRTVEPANPDDFLMVLNDTEAFLRAAVSASGGRDAG